MIRTVQKAKKRKEDLVMMAQKSTQYHGDGFVVLAQMDVQIVDPSYEAKLYRLPKHSKQIIILRHLMAGLKNGRKDTMSNPMLFVEILGM